MGVISLSKFTTNSAAPLVVFIDLQSEYTCEGRAYHLSTSKVAVDNCLRLLQKARQMRFPIAHFRQQQTGQYFNKASQFSQWIEGFSPRASEYVYDRALPSCFANTSFCELLRNIDDPEIIIAGFSGEQSCLSTVVESYHYGYRTVFIEDCSASRELDGMSEAHTHENVCKIIALYAETARLEEILGRLDERNSVRQRK